MENKESFEQIVSELENVVKQLEDKNISLDDAVNKYQKGLELAKKAYDLFDQAKEQIVKKVESGTISQFNELEE